MNNIINKHPILTNMFAKERIQKYIAGKLTNTELKVFTKSWYNDGSYDWEKQQITQSSFKVWPGVSYYDMIGIEEGDWVFLPSMENIPFYLNGELVTVSKYKDQRWECWYLTKLTLGDEAETIADVILPNWLSLEAA